MQAYILQLQFLLLARFLYSQFSPNRIPAFPERVNWRCWVKHGHCTATHCNIVRTRMYLSTCRCTRLDWRVDGNTTLRCYLIASFLSFTLAQVDITCITFYTGIFVPWFFSFCFGSRSMLPQLGRVG